MKDQYFGDVNDYAKYALLRRITGQERLSMTVCWMLTSGDGSTDGRFVDYLRGPERYASLDPRLFGFLLDALTTGRREVAAIESSGLLGDVTFHRQLLTDDLAQRREFFRRVWHGAERHDVIFFDPDNGLSPAGVTKSRRNARKYLFWDELAETVALGCSAVVYQHFPRVARAPFIEGTLSRMQAELRIAAFAIYTTKVAFLAAARPEHEPHLRWAMQDACASSGGLLRYAA